MTAPNPPFPLRSGTAGEELARRRGARQDRFGILIDSILIGAAGVFVFWLRTSLEGGTITWERGYRHLGFLLLYLALVLLFLQGEGVYTLAWARGESRELWAVAKGVLQGTVLLMVVFYLAQMPISRLMVLWLCGISLVALPAWRVFFWNLARKDVDAGNGWRHVLIIGAGLHGRELAGALSASSHLGVFVRGFLDDDRSGEGVLGRVADLPRVLDRYLVDEVFIASPLASDQWESVLAEVRQRQKNIWLLPRPPVESAAMRPDWRSLELVGGRPIVPLHWVPVPVLCLLLKRTIDLSGSFFGLLLLSPLLLGLAIAIKVQDGGPVFYHSTRIGRKGRSFECWKFRTMVTDAEAKKAELAHRNERQGPMFKVTDDPRVTPLGRWLRKYSLDELPQLWNVLKGEMSLVGPRPPTPDEVERYEQWSVGYYRRLDVKPGMTSLWAVEARSDPRFERAVELDRHYIEHWSPWLDLQILLRTIPAVFRGQGK
ncbi:undecaprenyl-phosphate galactose phosphotransferase [Methylacidimicrobium cyclopophantes]|uniref:Undecaprenyl-phosphate galactose phosphotransferase n=1 Tax=Methylacidimicrobium cyclopophantes TaxID=1041766 RepID=A0A5E6MQF7_9BACT|nr:sugar transferase [Methylacidimicrobium cyclopophantes]VVM07835.1 undecaprenyl-phosphate galactose phosphotransferase [Methylacidimicrobium cyclopophantes]